MATSTNDDDSKSERNGKLDENSPHDSETMAIKLYKDDSGIVMEPSVSDSDVSLNKDDEIDMNLDTKNSISAASTALDSIKTDYLSEDDDNNMEFHDSKSIVENINYENDDKMADVNNDDEKCDKIDDRRDDTDAGCDEITVNFEVNISENHTPCDGMSDKNEIGNTTRRTENADISIDLNNCHKSKSDSSNSDTNKDIEFNSNIEFLDVKNCLDKSNIENNINDHEIDSIVVECGSENDTKCDSKKENGHEIGAVLENNHENGYSKQETELEQDANAESIEIDSDSQMLTAENSDVSAELNMDSQNMENIAEIVAENPDLVRLLDANPENETETESEPQRRRQHLSDDSESDSDELDDDEEIKNSSSDDEEKSLKADKLFVQKQPPQNWKVIPELQQRQIGTSNRTPSSMFRERIMGSLRMVQRLTLMHKMEYHQGCVNALNFNRIGTLLASGSDDLNIVLWNWVQNKPALIYDSGHRGNVFQAKFMPFSGDCHIVSCARDGQVRLAELSLTGICKATKKVGQHKSSVHKLALEYDSPHSFLSCGEDGVVLEIDLREDKPHRLLCVKESGRRIPLYSIHTNPTSSVEFCVSGLDQFIRVYDKRKISTEDETSYIKRFCPHHLLTTDSKANVTCACYNYNGTEIVGTYNDENIYLFSNEHSSESKYIHKYEGHRNNSTVKGVNFYGPKSEYVISGSDCGNLYFWDKNTEAIVQYLEADHTGVVNVSEPHPFAPVLATSGLDNDVKVWAPIAQDATSLKGIHKVTKKNKRNRDYRQSHDPQDLLDSQILLFLMRASRRANQRRQANNDDTESDNDDDDDDTDDDSDEDGGQLLRDPSRCVPS